MKVTLKKPLPSGSYTVNWKIVGRDGHPISGSYSFNVEVQAVAETPQPAQSVASSPAEPSGTSSSSPSGEEQAIEKQSQQENATSTNTWVIAGVIVAGLILVSILIYPENLSRQKAQKGPTHTYITSNGK